jgi:hypothetical protein
MPNPWVSLRREASEQEITIGQRAGGGAGGRIINVTKKIMYFFTCNVCTHKFYCNIKKQTS